MKIVWKNKKCKWLMLAPQFACGFNCWFPYHHTPHSERDQPRSLLTSCTCAFLAWALIQRHLDKTATPFLHFNNSKGSNGQCAAVVKKDALHWFAFALTLEMRGSISNWSKTASKKSMVVLHSHSLKLIWLQNLILGGTF